MKLLCSILTAMALAWIICCMRWLSVDRGVVRFTHDETYLWLAFGGIAWLIMVLWFLLTNPRLK